MSDQALKPCPICDAPGIEGVCYIVKCTNEVCSFSCGFRHWDSFPRQSSLTELEEGWLGYKPGFDEYKYEYIYQCIEPKIGDEFYIPELMLWHKWTETHSTEMFLIRRPIKQEWKAEYVSGDKVKIYHGVYLVETMTLDMFDGIGKLANAKENT